MWIKKRIPAEVKSLLKRLLHKRHSDRKDTVREQTKKVDVETELQRISVLPGFTKGNTDIFGVPIGYADSTGFVVCYNEIFQKHNYLFKTENPAPYIIDCGANIGLSIIYLKSNFPASRIVAFEPDPNLFAILSENIRQFNYQGVTLHQKALWSSETELEFILEGGLAGKIRVNEDGNNVTKVRTALLSAYIDTKVDLLKIDVEGAEVEVVSSIRNELERVERIFIEYHSNSSEKQQLHELLNTLTAAGFRYQIKEASVAVLPFLDGPIRAKRPGFDLQLDIFAYRVR